MLEDILKDDPDQDDQEEEEEEVMESEEEEIHYENYKKCISREDMSETEEADGENHEDEGGDENSEHDDVWRDEWRGHYLTFGYLEKTEMLISY